MSAGIMPGSGALFPGMLSPGMCGSRGGFASSGASRERLRHPPLPRVELGRIWLPGRIWLLGAGPGELSGSAAFPPGLRLGSAACAADAVGWAGLAPARGRGQRRAGLFPV